MGVCVRMYVWRLIWMSACVFSAPEGLDATLYCDWKAQISRSSLPLTWVIEPQFVRKNSCRVAGCSLEYGAQLKIIAQSCDCMKLMNYSEVLLSCMVAQTVRHSLCVPVCVCVCVCVCCLLVLMFRWHDELWCCCSCSFSLCPPGSHLLSLPDSSVLFTHN